MPRCRPHVPLTVMMMTVPKGCAAADMVVSIKVADGMAVDGMAVVRAGQVALMAQMPGLLAGA